MGKSQKTSKSKNHTRHSNQSRRSSQVRQPAAVPKSERHIFRTVFRWAVIFACVSMMISAGFSLSSLLLAIVAIFTLPFQPIEEFWDALCRGKQWFRVVILAIIFFIAAAISPANDRQPGELSPAVERFTEIAGIETPAPKESEPSAAPFETEPEPSAKSSEAPEVTAEPAA